MPVEGKLLGDGLMAVFTSARQAIECGVRVSAVAGETAFGLHLGLHVGDVIREDNNVFGGAVNIAARVAALAPPGEVLVSETVRSLAFTRSSRSAFMLVIWDWAACPATCFADGTEGSPV